MALARKRQEEKAEAERVVLQDELRRLEDDSQEALRRLCRHEGASSDAQAAAALAAKAADEATQVCKNIRHTCTV